MTYASLLTVYFLKRGEMKSDRKLSLMVDALHQRIDDVKRLPDSKTRERALKELRSKLRRVEKKIPQ